MILIAGSDFTHWYSNDNLPTIVFNYLMYRLLLLQGSLYHHIDHYGALKEQIASMYTRQLLEGVEYLHVRKIVHRDIKGQ